MYTPISYYASANNQAAGVVADAPFVIDGQFSSRNNHPIMTADFDIVAATAAGATLTAAQIDSPSIDAWNPLAVYPVFGSIAVPANPNVMDLRQQPVKLPLDEEIQFQIAGGAAGAERDLGLIWLRASGPGANDYPIPPATRDMPRFIALGTYTLAITQGVWSPWANMTFTKSLRGGAYQINGLWTVCPGGLAYQINFFRMPMYQNIKLYPGNLVDASYSNQPLRFGGNWLGGLGRFNNFELPQIRILAGTTTGSATLSFWADLSYLGDFKSVNSVPY